MAWYHWLQSDGDYKVVFTKCGSDPEYNNIFEAALKVEAQKCFPASNKMLTSDNEMEGVMVFRDYRSYRSVSAAQCEELTGKTPKQCGKTLQDLPDTSGQVKVL